MNPKSYLLDEDRGVSPVIGVILMVAITVILAAVIATFVMNMGPNEETVPTASWDITDESNGISIDHTGGGGADASTLSVVVSYTSDVSGSANQETFDLVSDIGYGQGITLNASSSFMIYNNSAAWDDGSPLDGFSKPYGEMGSDDTYILANVESVELVWNAENSDQSEILSSWEA